MTLVTPLTPQASDVLTTPSTVSDYVGWVSTSSISGLSCENVCALVSNVGVANVFEAAVPQMEVIVTVTSLTDCSLSADES